MEDNTEAILLSELPEGRSGVVRKIDGGRGFILRLAEMGISSGTEVRVVRGRGPFVL